MEIPEGLKRRVGPLPVWGYVAGGTAAVVAFVVLRKRGNSNSAAGVGIEPPPAPVAPGSGGGGIMTVPGPATPSAPETAPDTSGATAGILQSLNSAIDALRGAIAAIPRPGATQPITPTDPGVRNLPNPIPSYPFPPSQPGGGSIAPPPALPSNGVITYEPQYAGDRGYAGTWVGPGSFNGMPTTTPLATPGTSEADIYAILRDSISRSSQLAPAV